ncbi:MAG: hypothetical protein ACOC8E_06035 [Planctomycetota bacterium]
MKQYIAFDSRKHDTWVERKEVATGKGRRCRMEHGRGVIRKFLTGRSERGTPVAVQAIGNWYGIVGEIEQAGGRPLLVHPRKAKLMMGNYNKTDKLDLHGPPCRRPHVRTRVRVSSQDAHQKLP